MDTLNLSDFVFQDSIIGKGGYGQVYLARYKKNNLLYAIKRININVLIFNNRSLKRNKIIENIKKEIQYLKLLSSYPFCYPHIVCYYGYIETNDSIYIIMEYIDGMTLDDKFYSLFKTKIDDSYDYILYILKQILETLVYIHEKGIAHGDIKPNNILITKNNKVSIIDFGISCLINDKSCYGRIVGTKVFMAPEIFMNKTIYTASDIWALGITIYSLYNREILRYISNLSNTINIRIPPLNTKNELLNDLINSMLILDYIKRPTAKQLLDKLNLYKFNRQYSYNNMDKLESNDKSLTKTITYPPNNTIFTSYRENSIPTKILSNNTSFSTSNNNYTKTEII